MTKPVLHGRDHRPASGSDPGGCDPIPGLSSGDSTHVWARISSSSVSITASASEKVEFEQFYTNDNTIIQTTPGNVSGDDTVFISGASGIVLWKWEVYSQDWPGATPSLNYAFNNGSWSSTPDMNDFTRATHHGLINGNNDYTIGGSGMNVLPGTGSFSLSVHMDNTSKGTATLVDLYLNVAFIVATSGATLIY